MTVELKPAPSEEVNTESSVVWLIEVVVVAAAVVDAAAVEVAGDDVAAVAARIVVFAELGVVTVV